MMKLKDTTPEMWDELKREIWPRANAFSRDIKPEDVVNKPVHYNTGGIECIDSIKASMCADAFQGYLKGNTSKYLWRMDYKGKKLEDLRKAQWYLNRLIEEVEEEVNE